MIRFFRHIVRGSAAPSVVLRGMLVLGLLCVCASARAASPTLQLNGVSGELQDNIRAHVTISTEACELASWRERATVRNARRAADNALRALGYYSAEIHAELIRADGCWAIRMNVAAGPRVTVTEVLVSVTGSAEQDTAFRDALRNPLVRPGDPLRHDLYEQMRGTLTRLAADRGYFESQWRAHRLEVDIPRQQARIVLHLESGPRYQFGDVTLEQDVLNDDLAARFIPFLPGDPYDNRELIGLQQALNSSGYYGNVRIRSEPDSAERRVHVTAVTTARPRHGYLAGIGFSTDTGPRLRLGYENRRVNRAGHRYNAEVETSPVRTTAGLNYEIPIDPAREKISLSGGYRTEDTDTSFSERYRLGVAHQIELNSGWVATTSLEFEREHFTVADVRDRTDLVMPGFELARTRSDHPIYPRRGWHLGGKVRFAEENFLSSVTFVQFRGRARLIFPALGGRILTRADLGVTEADELVELPTSVRFFAGGDASVRGYAYESLGPVNDDGEVIGGRHMFTGSIEYDYLFLPSWSVAVFADGGNAFDTVDSFEPVYGFGVGIRWRSPIGPIRLDVARPTDHSDNFRIHVSMGPDL